MSKLDAQIVRQTGNPNQPARLLTELAAHHYGIRPDQLRLEAHARGNPVVVSEDGREIECSISRSAPFLAVALLTPGETGWIGIDIEPLDALTVPAQEFTHILGPNESPLYEKVRKHGTEDDLGRALLQAWVRKEAVAKSMHTGFRALEPHEIECGPPEDARCTSYPWITVTDTVTDEYVAALAYNPV